jgi:hypothetical protein
MLTTADLQELIENAFTEMFRNQRRAEIALGNGNEEESNRHYRNMLDWRQVWLMHQQARKFDQYEHAIGLEFRPITTEAFSA